VGKVISEYVQQPVRAQLERQKILRTLCDKIMVYADGSIILEGLIEMIARLLKQTAPRTTWEKKHADYITFAFDFALT
jgi:hypothetical protein